MTDMVPTSLPGAAAVGGCESTGILGSFGGFNGCFLFPRLNFYFNEEKFSDRGPKTELDQGLWKQPFRPLESSCPATSWILNGLNASRFTVSTC